MWFSAPLFPGESFQNIQQTFHIEFKQCFPTISISEIEMLEATRLNELNIEKDNLENRTSGMVCLSFDALICWNFAISDSWNRGILES